ncbi:kinesin-like protein KIF26A, partial [Biomphalaria glabrata]
AGGRSRLHLIDLGTASKSKDPNNVSLSLSALGNVIMALLNGQRHVPHRDSKIAQLLRDSLGNLSCRTCMIAHVSSAVPHYNETLQVIQLAARIHRMKRRRTKFSSTSSEDSSTDGDVKFRRPYRGLRMGTLREDVLYSSSHSDPDYTSSSEQSCDTVIYLGANGQSLSDRELTDNEGPPRHVPRTNPRLPRRPSGSRSSGDDSDSGRSVHSARSLESRLPIRALMSPPPGVGVAKLGSPTPGSPNPGLVKMGHRMAAHNKLNSDGRTAEPGQASAMWQEKPTKIHCHASQRELAKAIHEKQQPLEGEQWIDGPGAAMYPESSGSEMWVDGPPAFVVQQQPQSVLSATPRPPDGQHSSHHHHHRSDPLSRRVASKKVDAEEHWVDGPKEMIAGSNLPQPMHTCIKSDHLSKVPPKSSMSAGVSEKALKQALVKHIMEVKDRPESSLSVDSESSMAVIPAESRPQSFNSSDDQCSNSAPSKDTSDSSTRSDLKQDASSSPMVSSKKQKLHDQKKISASKQSSVDSPGPSPALSRKCSKADPAHIVRLQKTQLPGSASPTHRVVQWIKSVSSEQDTPAASHLIASAANISMTDAETNTEHDSDFERMAEENGLRCDSDEGANEAVSKDKVNDITCNITAGETSLDSSFDTSMVNRESIYEMEVEEHLEKMRSKDGSRLAADVDNETFSSMSCSNHDDTERDQHCLENESLLLQHTKALTESKQTAQINRHIARSYSKRDISPSDLEKEIEELSRPLLSRKPDGASNPNLMKTFFEEDMLTKGHLGTMPAISLEAMYVQAGHNDSGVDFPTTSSKSCRGVLGNDDSFCDKNVSLQSLSEKSDAFNCSLKQTKTKPPLPSKQSPVLKQSGLPKPSSSSPSRSIYCVAKPTKDSQQKAGANGKHTAVPVVSPSMRNKFSRVEKNSSSSSGVSPLSSATSSPLVSNASKSSSSSPVQKCSSKVPSAFSSSRNSSPTAKDSKGRKKEKEPKGGSSARSKLSDIIHKGKGNDSDSGNDSGIVAHEKKLLSPYATVTKPRTPSHSSSGHGSDNSTISTEVHPGHVHPCAKAETLHGGTSSGYESMLRDSEATCSSSGHDDSGSESSSECKKGSKRKGTRRSRSAPSRSTESSPASSQPSQAGSRSNGPTHKAWVDTRHLHKVKDEPLELKKYDPDEVERLNRRRLDEEKNSKGEDVTGDDESKDRIMMERNGWSFDCKFFMCFSCKSRQRGTDV